MKTKQTFALNILSYIFLIVGVVLDYWGLASTLFYFVIEASISSGIAAYWFKPNGRKHIGLRGALAGGMGAGLLTFTFVYFLAILAGEVNTTIKEMHTSGIQFFIDMILLTWPLIIFKVIATILEYKDIDKITIEKTAWSFAIHSIMSVFIAFVLTFFFISIINLNHTLVIIATILMSRALFDLYLFRTILGLKVNSTNRDK